MDGQVYELRALKCPGCGSLTSAYKGASQPKSAVSYATCLRRCETCRIGASNGRSVTWIYDSPTDSIPAQARPGAREALGDALNIRNRVTKLRRFGFYPTSEDAVTWVVFSQLHRSGQLGETLGELGLIPRAARHTRPALLLWGSPVDAGPRGQEIRSRIESICKNLGERSDSYSEPDVIVDFGDHGVVFIEVKHRSGNDIKKNTYAGWEKYCQDPSIGWTPEAVIASGCYELARNWLIMAKLAENRPARLLNLGPASLFSPEAPSPLETFTTALGNSGQRAFSTKSWSDFRAAVSREHVPAWIFGFLDDWQVV